MRDDWIEQLRAYGERGSILGDDSVKHRLRDDLPKIFEAAPEITGAQPYAEDAGRELVGELPP
ncbi:hypothetical protein [Streptomyces sp. NPDC091217]|uniref:hypothetical protein n=1 Tax=Streptomyces sp. NPDC091217 TaxID=3365975 RepID=UPI00382C0B0A